MILRRVELARFGKWTDRVFEFRRGTNLVIGGNEAGKTTLAAAIPAVLFGVQDKERFVPWGGTDGCSAALVWEDRQHFWRLERNMCSDEVALTVWHEGGEVLRQFSGRADAGVPRGEYAELLRELCGSGGAEPLLQTQTDIVFPLPQSLLGTESKRPGGLPDTEEELQAVRRQLAQLEARWYALRPLAGQLQEVVRQLEESPQDLPAVAAPAEPEPPVMAAKSSWPAPASEGGSDRLQRRQQLQEELTRLGLPPAMPADLPLLLAEAEALRRELVGLQKEAVTIREARATRPDPPWKAAAVTSLAVFLLGLAGSLWLSWSVGGWLGGALLAALVWLANSYFHSRHLAEDARLKGQAQAIEGRRELAQESLSALDDRFRGVGISPSAVSLVKMQKGMARGQVIADELRRLEGAVSALEGMADAGAAPATVALAPLLDKSEAVPPAAAAPSAEGPAPCEERQALLREQERLQELLRERQHIEEEGERLRDREAALVLQTKEDAAAITPGDESSAGRQFADECARLLALLGDRRPWQVAVTDQGSLVMRADEGGWHSPFAYGHGACDLLGLATRLAADGSSQLPLLFDEALGHLERSRRADIFGSLERIAAQRQVIVFCREDQLPKRLARERWQVLSLDVEPISRERDEHAGQMHLL